MAALGGESKADGRPVGLPVNCVVRLRPPSSRSGESKVAIEDNTVRIPSTDETFSFNALYGPRTSQDDLFAAEMKRVLNTVLEGYSASVVTVGASRSGRDFTLRGAANDGLVPLSVEELFHLLQQKMQGGGHAGARSRYDARRSSFTVTVSYFEVVQDTVRDLLAAPSEEAPALEVEYGELSATVPGMTVLEVRHPDEFHQLFTKAQHNRTRGTSSFGPLAPRASVFLTFDVEMRLAPAFERLLCKLTFVQLPATELLMEDAEKLRARQGPRLNRELLGLAGLVRRLSEPSEADFAEYGMCKTTELLDDVLGGNCITLAVATVDPSRVAESRATLEFAQRLNRIVNYPVHNDERVVGLVRRLRMQVYVLREELERLEEHKGLPQQHGSSQKQQQQQDTAALVAQDATVIELKSKLLRSDLDRTRLTKEKKQLYESYGEFRNKYQQLVKAKADLQSELIKSEEERLRVSKLLIDVQIENTDLKEQATTQQYELEARLLTYENEAVERERMEKGRLDENAHLKEQLEAVLAEKKDLSMEYVALRQNYNNVRHDLEEQQAKHRDVGAELLHLVNAKTVLEEKAEALEQEAVALREANKELDEFKQQADARADEQERRMQQLESDNERLRLDAVRRDVEAQKTVQEFEAKKIELEKNYVRMAMEKDAEVSGLRQMTDKEHVKFTELREKHQKEVETLQRELSLAQRRAHQYESKTVEQTKEVTELHAQVRTLKEQKAAASEEFRSKLLEFISAQEEENDEENEEEQEEARGDGRVMKKADGGGTEAANKNVEQMYREMLDAHISGERELREENEALSERVSTITVANRELSSQYRVLSEFVKEILPNEADVPVLEEKDLQSLTQGPDLGTERHKAEVALLRGKLHDAQQQLEQQRQLTLKQAEGYQQTTGKLQKQHSRLQDQFAALTKEHSLCGSSVSREMMEDQRKALNEMQSFLETKFRTQLEDIKTTAVDAAQREELHALRDRVQELRAENDKLRSSSGGGGGGGGAGLEELKERWAEAERNYKRQIARLREQVHESRSRPGTGAAAAARGGEDADMALVKKQLSEFRINTQRKLERERAEYKTRAVAAEEEVANFQRYMQQEARRYQQAIMALEKQVAYWKAAAKSRGAPDPHSNPATSPREASVTGAPHVLSAPASVASSAHGAAWE